MSRFQVLPGLAFLLTIGANIMPVLTGEEAKAQGLTPFSFGGATIGGFKATPQMRAWFKRKREKREREEKDARSSNNAPSEQSDDV